VKDRVVTAPSYEQLAALVAAEERTIARLQARIAEQDAEVAEPSECGPQSRTRENTMAGHRAPATVTLR